MIYAAAYTGITRCARPPIAVGRAGPHDDNHQCNRMNATTWNGPNWSQSGSVYALFGLTFPKLHSQSELFSSTARTKVMSLYGPQPVISLLTEVSVDNAFVLFGLLQLLICHLFYSKSDLFQSLKQNNWRGKIFVPVWKTWHKGASSAPCVEMGLESKFVLNALHFCIVKCFCQVQLSCLPGVWLSLGRNINSLSRSISN